MGAPLNIVAFLLRMVLSKVVAPKGPSDFGVADGSHLVRFGYGQFAGLSS